MEWLLILVFYGLIGQFLHQHVPVLAGRHQAWGLKQKPYWAVGLSG